MKRYLDSHGFEATWVRSFDDVGEHITGFNSARAVICDGNSGSVDEIRAFHARLKELDRTVVSCYLLGKSQSQELAAELAGNDCAVMQLPASLREVRTRVDELLTAERAELVNLSTPGE